MGQRPLSCVWPLDPANTARSPLSLHLSPTCQMRGSPLYPLTILTSHPLEPGTHASAIGRAQTPCPTPLGSSSGHETVICVRPPWGPGGCPAGQELTSPPTEALWGPFWEDASEQDKQHVASSRDPGWHYSLVPQRWPRVTMVRSMDLYPWLKPQAARRPRASPLQGCSFPPNPRWHPNRGMTV